MKYTDPLLLLFVPFLLFFLFSVTLMLLLLLLVLLLWLRLALHCRLLLLWLRLALCSRLLLFSGGGLSRTWFGSFGTGYTSWAALVSLLPPGSLAMMVLLEKFLAIMLTLPVFTPIRILTVKTLPV